MDLLLLGLALGAGAGVSPGPLMVLVVTSALRGGWRAGALAACAPVVTDLVVVAGVLLVLDQLPPVALSVLAVAGGLFLLGTAAQNLRGSRGASLAGSAEDRRRAGRQALWQAGVVNLLSPHPWLFWATVLGPLTLRAWHASPPGAVVLVVGFYLAIVGTKVLLAVAVAGGRRWLTDTAYRRLLVAAGVLLGLVGVLVLVEFLPRVVGS